MNLSILFKCTYSFSFEQIHIQPTSILHPPAAGLIADNKPQAKTLLRGTTMEAVNLKKLMHRFTIEEVLRAMQEVEHEVGVGVGPDT